MTARSKFAALLEASRAGMPWRRDGDVAPTVIVRPDLPPTPRKMKLLMEPTQPDRIEALLIEIRDLLKEPK